LLRFTQKASHVEETAHNRAQSESAVEVADIVGTASGLKTSEVTVISHTHGRQRREEREIRKRELQEAVKYGRCERANPGRDGSRRWRFTHKGVIYITDDTRRHGITSWRMAEAGPEEAVVADSDAETGVHTVLIVDCSGSMRKGDVSGYASRTAAVYKCLARDFIEPQLAAALGSDRDHIVTLIEMSDAASVRFSRRPMDHTLAEDLRKRANSLARSHGNYIPALEKALEVLRHDAAHRRHLYLLFLSDGAPSDHTDLPCDHGVMVWQNTHDAPMVKGRPGLLVCKDGGARCRAEVKEWVLDRCLDRVTRLGDLFGRDRTFIGTVAFGPPDEDYVVLERMAAQLPRGSFQRLGLSALNLRTAFSTLTSSLTSLRSDAAAGAARMTQRAVQVQRGVLREAAGWDVYRRSRGEVVSKRQYDGELQRFVDADWAPGADGVAHSVVCFGQVRRQEPGGVSLAVEGGSDWLGHGS
jgi:hypothetical protein